MEQQETLEARAMLVDEAAVSADPRHQIELCISNNQVVPPKYFYCTPEGSACWLELSRQSHTEYDFYNKSLAALRQQTATLASRLVGWTGTAEINVVDVGCGDGVKDNILLRELEACLNDGQHIGYYPLDISDVLVEEATRNALGGLNPDSFHVEAIVADYSNLKQVLGNSGNRTRAPHLFTALGNTVGNGDEEQLIDAISEAMLPGDLVLLEVNIGTPDITNPLWKNPAAVEHDFVPLATLNVPFDLARMRFSLVEGQSFVEGTRSVLISYCGAELNGQVVDEVKLFVMHYYDRANFASAIEKRMNVRALWAQAVGDVYLVLAAAEH